MSFSWTYLTRRFMLQSYRDAIGVSIIFSFFASKFLQYNSKKSDNEWTLVRPITDHFIDARIHGGRDRRIIQRSDEQDGLRSEEKQDQPVRPGDKGGARAEGTGDAARRV